MKQIIPVVMNTSFIRLAAIDTYNSLIWTSRYYTCGDFELCVDASAKNKALFQKDYYIVRDDDENVGIIEKVVIQRTDDGISTLIVSGRFLDAIIARRIIAEQTTVTGKVSACIEQLLTDNIIDPADTDRQIDNFTIDSYEVATTMQAQYTGKNLLDVIFDIGMTYGIGHKVTLNDGNEYVFKLYEGADRTYDQTTNPWVIFSDKYDNLLAAEYEENYQNLATAVLVAGEGEGLDRRTLWVSDGSTGINRHEVYKDARNVRSNEGDISDAEYEDLLEESGKESLTKYTTAFTGTVYFDSIKYKDDVELGDLCVIENTTWGIYITSRLVEVIESVDESGDYSIIPTFGV